MTKSLRRDIYGTQPELAELFPEKPVETALIEEEIEYTKQLVRVLKDRLTYKSSRKQYEKVTALLEDDKIKEIQSSEDMEATIGHKPKEDSFFGYKNHLAINDERLITGIEVTTGRAADTKILEELAEQSKRNGMEVTEILGDKAYSSKDNIDYCNENDIKLVSRLNSVISNGNNRDEEYVYNKDAGTMRCEKRNGKNGNIYYKYVFSKKKCKKCPRNGTCYTGQKEKTYSITILGEAHEKQYEFEQSEYFKKRIKERYKIEAKNAELKQVYGLARCKYTGLFGMKIPMYFTALVANAKRIIRLKELNSV